mmetsp:Transcript_3134/g.9128  ORF Transcript_3134/g.9128 Transcript_3134/m.9128 type:complete len:224 (-) Transcript_3134:33-704(-)
MTASRSAISRRMRSPKACFRGATTPLSSAICSLKSKRPARGFSRSTACAGSMSPNSSSTIATRSTWLGHVVASLAASSSCGVCGPANGKPRADVAGVTDSGVPPPTARKGNGGTSPAGIAAMLSPPCESRGGAVAGADRAEQDRAGDGIAAMFVPCSFNGDALASTPTPGGRCNAARFLKPNRARSPSLGPASAASPGRKFSSFAIVADIACAQRAGRERGRS